MKHTSIALIAVFGIITGAVADRLLIGTEVHAQQATRISIGSESVSIGMSKDAAIAKFAGKYAVGDLHDGRVAIMKSEREPKIVRSLGVLNFEHERLTSATRYWGDFWDGTDDNMEPLWNALRGAMSRHIGSNRIAVEMESSEVDQPSSHEEWISVHFPKGNIEIGKHEVRVNNRNGTNFYVRETVF